MSSDNFYPEENTYSDSASGKIKICEKKELNFLKLINFTSA